MASTAREHGNKGRVWDLDSGALTDPTPIVPSRHGACAHCGGADGQMLRVLREGQALAFCDNGRCTLSVSAVATFTPMAAYPGMDAIEFIGTVRCPGCERTHIIGGPPDNWTLGWCSCGHGVLARPDPTALLAVAS